MILLVAGGVKGTAGPAQANIRIASSTTNLTLASTLSVAAALAPGARPAARYVVRPGDTLSGIAARLAVRGGWPALYAANRPVIGPDPDVIRAGTVLVLPGRAAPATSRYTVVAGDTLAGIAAGLGVRGGWPVLYAVNRRVIGPDPDVIRPGTVLRIPSPAAPSPSPAAANPGRRMSPPPPSGLSGPAGSRSRPAPARVGGSGPAASGMPRWLTTVLLAAGLLIGTAFLAEPVLLYRRRRAAARTASLTASPAQGPVSAPGPVPGPGPVSAPGPVSGRGLVSGRGPACGRFAAGRGRVVLADYDRVVVTRSGCDDTVYVLRPPGEDPEVILRAARLVLAEGPYRELAGRLGLPASWPIVLADYDRVVVTRSAGDDTVYVLRPPGEDPEVILRAARLVLPEGPYGELADQLGIPAGLPMH
jgi:LysM repeat protein